MRYRVAGRLVFNIFSSLLFSLSASHAQLPTVTRYHTGSTPRLMGNDISRIAIDKSEPCIAFITSLGLEGANQALTLINPETHTAHHYVASNLLASVPPGTPNVHATLPAGFRFHPKYLAHANGKLVFLDGSEYPDALFLLILNEDTGVPQIIRFQGKNIEGTPLFMVVRSLRVFENTAYVLATGAYPYNPVTYFLFKVPLDAPVPVEIFQKGAGDGDYTDLDVTEDRIYLGTKFGGSIVVCAKQEVGSLGGDVKPVTSLGPVCTPPECQTRPDCVLCCAAEGTGYYRDCTRVLRFFLYEHINEQTTYLLSGKGTAPNILVQPVYPPNPGGDECSLEPACASDVGVGMDFFYQADNNPHAISCFPACEWNVQRSLTEVYRVYPRYGSLHLQLAPNFSYGTQAILPTPSCALEKYDYNSIPALPFGYILQMLFHNQAIYFIGAKDSRGEIPNQTLYELNTTQQTLQHLNPVLGLSGITLRDMVPFEGSHLLLVPEFQGVWEIDPNTGVVRKFVKPSPNPSPQDVPILPENDVVSVAYEPTKGLAGIALRNSGAVILSGFKVPLIVEVGVQPTEFDPYLQVPSQNQIHLLFKLTKDANVTIEVWDTQTNTKVKTLLENEPLLAGQQVVEWTGLIEQSLVQNKKFLEQQILDRGSLIAQNSIYQIKMFAVETANPSNTDKNEEVRVTVRKIP